MNSMTLMRLEFAAAKELSEQYRRITFTAPVDDDFQEVKFDYDRAATAFVEAYNRNHLD